jgi:hypothetical protein
MTVARVARYTGGTNRTCDGAEVFGSVAAPQSAHTMNPSAAHPEKKNVKPLETQSQDAARLKVVKPRPAWETRQPAQITKGDVEEAQSNPSKVRPPGEMGESQGAAS